MAEIFQGSITLTHNLQIRIPYCKAGGGSRIFLRRGAPLKNDKDEEEDFISGGGGVYTVHPLP